jgi:insulin-like growth factor-binding protein complex acid labile subunit
VLDGNSVRVFRNDSFVSRELAELKTLTADNCNIRKIGIGAFNGLTNLAELSMGRNEISEIKPGTFEKMSSLENLRLDYNRIDQLDSDTFCGLVYLKNISLKGNNLQYIHPDTFFGLPNLQRLNLSQNRGLQTTTDRQFINSHSLKHLDISRCNVSSVSVETFGNVSKLESLDLSYNNLETVDINIFSVLPELSELNLGNNKVSEITPGTIENMSSLENLHLDYNRIDKLGSYTFCGLVNLKNINLNSNNLQDIHPDTFFGLPNLQDIYLSLNFDLQIPTDRHFINSYSLKHLDMSSCGINSVSVETFANVSKLEWLDLRVNYLSRLDINMLTVLPELSELNLEGNGISEIIPGTFGSNSRLEYLHLGYNKIEHLGSDTFCGLVNLKYISLEGNGLQYIHPDTFLGLPNLQDLILFHNSGLQIPTDRHFINSHSLKRLDISGCNINSVSFETFANVSALEKLYLSGNNLILLDINTLTVLPELSELYLEGSKIREIIPGTFEKTSRLEYLHLNYNEIEHLGSGTFGGLFKLKHISLGTNNLQYIHPDTFFGLPNLQDLHLSFNSDLIIATDRRFINSHSLKRLDISGCNINSVSFETFANVSALEGLYLSNNNLRTVDINILTALPELSTLYLYLNPLHCDCQLQEVWRWCLDHNIQTAYEYHVPRCDTPREVKGMWWGVLEKGQCSQGNIEYYGDYRNTRYSYTPTEDMDTDTERGKEKNVSSFVKQNQLPVSAVLFIFGTIGNVILIIIIVCNKDMRTVPNMYILNLAISDIIHLTLLFYSAWPNSVTWLRGDIMCTFLPFCSRISVGLTAYFIAVLSFERYRVTVNPLHVPVSSQPTWRATVATVGGVWIVAALSAVPEARSKVACGAITVIGITNYYHYVVIFDLLVSCVIPLCVIAFSYIMTARQLVKNSCSLSEGTQNPQFNTRNKTAKVVLALTVVFLISYVPYHIWKTFLSFSMSSDISGATFKDKFVLVNNFQDTITILYLFLSINSCLNPLALCCTSLASRRQLKSYLTCCCKTNSPQTDFELTRRN